MKGRLTKVNQYLFRGGGESTVSSELLYLDPSIFGLIVTPDLDEVVAAPGHKATLLGRRAPKTNATA